MAVVAERGDDDGVESVTSVGIWDTHTRPVDCDVNLAAAILNSSLRTGVGVLSGSPLSRIRMAHWRVTSSKARGGAFSKGPI